VACLQPVAGHLRAQMMDVVEPDISRNPLQHPGQGVERAAFQSRPREIPPVPGFPIDALELVLNVKQPHACRRCRYDDRQSDDQKRLPAHQQPQPAQEHEQRQIGKDDAPELAFARAPRGDPVQQGEHGRGPNREKKQRVAHDPVACLPPPGSSKVLGHRHGRHVTRIALVDVACGGMVNGMVVPPLVEGSHGEDAQGESHCLVGLAGFEIGSMAAIVEDDERADPECAGDQSQWRHQPVGDAAGPKHDGPHCQEGQQTIHKLPEGLAQIRPGIRRDQGLPLRRCCSAVRHGELPFKRKLYPMTTVPANPRCRMRR